MKSSEINALKAKDVPKDGYEFYCHKNQYNLKTIYNLFNAWITPLVIFRLICPVQTLISTTVSF